MSEPDAAVLTPFTRYQKFAALLLAFLQFAVILDFMILSPLGALIMPALNISPSQFGAVVSAYAFSAGISGLLTAGFADRYDRKHLLLFFYAGFVVGTLWCGVANSYEMLLVARIVTGVFAGVIGSIVLAIAADIFPVHLRGRVMGIIQTAFAASQILGLPIGLYLSNHLSWHAPFLMMAALGAAGGMVIFWRLQPVTEHLKAGPQQNPLSHLRKTITLRSHLPAFATTSLLVLGGYLLMPFSSAYTVNNIGIDITSLPTIYLITGLCTIFAGPLIGRAADAFGKMPVFIAGSGLTIIMVLIYTHLGQVSLPVLVVINVLMFVGIFSRLIPFQALVASVPHPSRRGAFNAISAAIQQLSGGLASLLAGHIVSIGADGKLQNFEVVGYVLVASTLFATALAWQVDKGVKARDTSLQAATTAPN
jgi:predicted MFS family arabinose efflux permease